MKITPDLTDETVLRELGTRLARLRLDAGLTQATLAEQAGISKRTLERLEAGHPGGLVAIIRLLRVLRHAEGLEGLVAALPISPMALLKSRGKVRKRASHARRQATASLRAASAPAAQRPGGSHKPWRWAE